MSIAAKLILDLSFLLIRNVGERAKVQSVQERNEVHSLCVCKQVLVAIKNCS